MLLPTDTSLGLLELASATMTGAAAFGYLLVAAVALPRVRGDEVAAEPA